MAALYRLMPGSPEEAAMFRAEDYPSFSDLFDSWPSICSFHIPDKSRKA